MQTESLKSQHSAEIVRRKPAIFLHHLQRLSQESKPSITRDLHTRQRLDNSTSASTPPKSLINHPHAIHTQTLRTIRNTVHLNHSTVPKCYSKQAGISNTFWLIDKVCFRPAAPPLSARAIVCQRIKSSPLFVMPMSRFQTVGPAPCRAHIY